MPDSKGEDGGPRSVKCHSNRLVSRGDACRSGDGEVESSEASRRIRFMVGDLVLNFGVLIIVEGQIASRLGNLLLACERIVVHLELGFGLGVGEIEESELGEVSR